MDEWDPIPISRLSHAAYCPRRAALLTNEQLWSESADTAKGRLEHKRVHTARVERRGEDILLYETDVSSAVLGIGGKCDCVEAHGDPLGCMVPGISFPVRLYPIEYKHGKLSVPSQRECLHIRRRAGKGVRSRRAGRRHRHVWKIETMGRTPMVEAGSELIF